MKTIVQGLVAKKQHHSSQRAKGWFEGFAIDESPHKSKKKKKLEIVGLIQQESEACLQ